MELHVPGCRTDPPDALNAKQIHLTYAGLHRGELSFDALLDMAKHLAASRDGLLEYVIGRERHAEPAHPQRDEHFHVYLHFGKKMRLHNRRTTVVCDLPGRGGRTLHPEVQSVGSLPGDRERVIRYDIKEGDFRGELRHQLLGVPRFRAAGDASDADDGSDGSDDEGSTDDAAGGGKGTPRWAARLKQAADVRDGMQRLFEEAPAVYFTQGTRIQPMLEQAIGSPDEKLFSLADFRRPALDLSRPVLLHGKTNTGKSEYAEAHFDTPTVVRTRDDLKRATFFTDGIIFDDFDFCGWKPTEIIHLLSYTKNRSLPARYSDARIAAFTPIIFTTNVKPKHFFPKARNSEQQRAIRRRHRRVKVRRPLQRIGRAFTHAELQARRSVGKNGPRAPPDGARRAAHRSSQPATAYRRRQIVVSDSDSDGSD